MKVINFSSRITSNQAPQRRRGWKLSWRKVIWGLGLFTLSLSIQFLLSENSSYLATAAGPETISQKAQGKIIVANQASVAFPRDLSISETQQAVAAGRVYPGNDLEVVKLSIRQGGGVEIKERPEFKSRYQGKVAGISTRNEVIFYTLDPELQKYAQEIVNKADVPHVAVVAMEPNTGKILAIAEKSSTINDLSLHTGFPAASLFKIITAAAALEKDAIKPYSMVKFRGGNYTLNKWNYSPDLKKDKRSMSVFEAIGKSCNPVFARIGLKYLSPSILRRYVNNFGFNSPIAFDLPLQESLAHIPEGDFELSRTAAGFGEVRISPVHAAALMAGIANGGILPRPRLVNHVLSTDGELLYQARPEGLRRIVSLDTARTLMQMMQSTTTIGTSRKEFIVKNKPVLSVPVAAKTGTLSGTNPKGLNQWFVAAAPANDPKIAISVITVNPNPYKSRTKASHLGRQLIEKYL